jgi:hypothetical protein
MKALIFLAGLLILSACTQLQDPQAECNRVEGEWREFPNACADKCDAGDICAQVLTMSCDCGPDRCWNGRTCVPQ